MLPSSRVAKVVYLSGPVLGCMLTFYSTKLSAQTQTQAAPKVGGILQTQFSFAQAKNDAEKGSYHSFELKRLRLSVMQEFTSQVEGVFITNLKPEENVSIRSAYLRWKADTSFNFQMGIDRPQTTQEANTPAADLITIERSLLSKLLANTTSVNGASVDGAFAFFDYHLGLYTDEVNTNEKAEDPDYARNVKVGVELHEFISPVKKLYLSASHFLSKDDLGEFGENAKESNSVSLHLIADRFDLRAEYARSTRRSGDLLKAWYVMPSQYLSPNLQAVWRLESVKSQEDFGVTSLNYYVNSIDKLQTSEEEPQQLLAGDNYRSVYFGLNYYLEDSQKLMAGVELGELDSTSENKLVSTTASLAWRVKF